MSIEAMKQAHIALVEIYEGGLDNFPVSLHDKAIDDLRTAIEQAETAQGQEPVGEAYLCNKCQTPFDGAWECPSCGHRSATKEPVYTTPPAAPVQEHEHIVHSNGRYSPLLTRMMNKRTESNIKQVIHLYDEPSAAHVQEPKQGEIFCGVDFSDGVLSVSVLRRRPDEVAELLHSEQIELQPTAAQRQSARSAWVGLTDEEYLEAEKCVWAVVSLDDTEKEANREFYRAIEAKLREKNGGAA